MANIKLVGNSWEAEGIFDKTQNKTQKAINSEVISKLNSTATTSAAGLMSAADKTALDTAVTNIGTMSEMGTTATTLAGGIGELNDDLSAEQAAREAADSALQGSITDEQEARESAIENINALLASIENGNTATRNYDYREFVLWKGDLYVTKTQISSGTAFSSSNLITVPDGGFNEIQSRIGNLFASYTVFDNLSDLVSALNSRLTGEFIIAKISSTFSPTFFEDNTTRTSILIINKASSNNAYYLATTQDNIAIGNISLTSGTVTVRKDLAAKSNSLQLNSSISYPAYLTTGLWRTGNDGTINLSFPCTSLKESTNYTTTSTISLNIFMPGSADQASQALNQAITNVERITTDYIVLQIAAIEGVTANRIGFFSTRTAMTITAT